MKTRKVALFHPWIKSRGGAEKVVLEILEKSRHDVDIYTWIYEPENTFPEFKKYKIRVIAPGIAKRLSRLNVLRGFLLPLGILKKIPVKKYDLLLVSTSGMGEFVTFRSFKKGRMAAYVHTPLRESDKKIIKWNIENKYKGRFLKKSLYLAATKIYSGFEKMAWKRLNVIVFNSELSKSRAEERKLIDRKRSYVLNPPADLSGFNKIVSKRTGKKYFLYVSRLNPPKRQDVLLNAWIEFVKKFPDYHLVVAGTPENKSYFKKLNALAEKTENVEIKTNVSDGQLKELVSGCVAGIFLGYQEDFGILPLEILSANKPLIAVDEGGYVEMIKNHPNFHKIKERHNSGEMTREILAGLENFAVHGKDKKLEKVKIKTKDFINEIDRIIEDI